MTALQKSGWLNTSQANRGWVPTNGLTKWLPPRQVKQYVALWNTENPGSANDQIDLPMPPGPLVDWGDGAADNTNTHTYAAPGIYLITIDDTNVDFSSWSTSLLKVNGFPKTI